MKKTATVVENQTAAANALGVDPEIIRRARRLNCPACLAGGRYNIPELRKWIADNQDKLAEVADGGSLREQKISEEIRKLKIQNDKAEKLSVLKSWGASRNREIQNRVKELLYAKLENEYPPLFSNDVISNRTLGKKLADQIMMHFSEMASIWEN